MFHLLPFTSNDCFSIFSSFQIVRIHKTLCLISKTHTNKFCNLNTLNYWFNFCYIASVLIVHQLTIYIHKYLWYGVLSSDCSFIECTSYRTHLLSKGMDSLLDGTITLSAAIIVIIFFNFNAKIISFNKFIFKICTPSSFLKSFLFDENWIATCFYFSESVCTCVCYYYVLIIMKEFWWKQQPELVFMKK